MNESCSVSFGKFSIPWQRHNLGITKIPTEWKPWLIGDESLTLRLKKHCDSEFRVVVLRQSFILPHENERKVLGIPFRNRALIREVCLMCGDIPWVIARSVIPYQTLKGKGAQLKMMGNRPLGHFLFSDPHLVRSPIQISRCNLIVHHHTDDLINVASWGRRSMFSFYGKPLLVSEFFLPELLNKSIDFPT